MLHWSPSRAAVANVTPIGLFADAVRPAGPARTTARSDHVRMLAHAATRRRAAWGAERDYWKACAPAAVARAAAIRAAAGFPRLP